MGHLWVPPVANASVEILAKTAMILARGTPHVRPWAGALGIRKCVSV